MRLYDTLLALSEGGRVPFHMPGHGRSPGFDYLCGAESVDFTEIDGLDNLHAAEGILKEAMDHAARVWGADRMFFSVGGSTAGMLAAVRALCRGGKPLLLAGNAHRSACHAALLNRSPLHIVRPRLHPLRLGKRRERHEKPLRHDAAKLRRLDAEPLAQDAAAL